VAVEEGTLRAVPGAAARLDAGAAGREGCQSMMRRMEDACGLCSAIRAGASAETATVPSAETADDASASVTSRTGRKSASLQGEKVASSAGLSLLIWTGGKASVGHEDVSAAVSRVGVPSLAKGTGEKDASRVRGGLAGTRAAASLAERNSASTVTNRSVSAGGGAGSMAGWGDRRGESMPGAFLSGMSPRFGDGRPSLREEAQGD
jgi:hypothetical protein